jgi:hypothetical protein
MIWWLWWQLSHWRLVLALLYSGANVYPSKTAANASLRTEGSGRGKGQEGNGQEQGLESAPHVEGADDSTLASPEMCEACFMHLLGYLAVQMSVDDFVSTVPREANAGSVLPFIERCMMAS